MYTICIMYILGIKIIVTFDREFNLSTLCYKMTIQFVICNTILELACTWLLVSYKCFVEIVSISCSWLQLLGNKLQRFRFTLVLVL